VRVLGISLTALAALVALVSAPRGALAQAKGPAFDCSKAQGEVEQLVCEDEGLAALDGKLDEVYRTALAKARDGVPQLIRAEQRGWLKGRNECWKAKAGSPVYLTASWQADGVRACVEGSYRIRTSELQATMQLVPSKGPVYFACEGNPANEIAATFFATDPPTARLERGDKTVTAWLVPTASGSKYEGQDVEFWTKGKVATVTWLGTQMECLSVLAGVALAADEPVLALQDLMGAKGASVETAMTNRGYAYQGRGQAARSDFEYWREPKTNRCIGVRYRDNRAQAVAHASITECDKAAANKPTAPAPGATGFATVCGVTVEGKDYRYECTVEGVAPGAPGETTLHFPDNSVTLKWQGGKLAAATFAGMNPQDVAVTTAEGVTRFTFEGKPYFYVSDRGAAAAALKTLH
jgi:uncharacterized protein